VPIDEIRRDANTYFLNGNSKKLKVFFKIWGKGNLPIDDRGPNPPKYIEYKVQNLVVFLVCRI